ncbi:FAD/NAD(P)-binding domain-containing protein [Plenodomus tracheiphilus IPT5]|uniref:FAD/NAD(P)-binding domain-containing protein n=1 Tax=Plenodomus tracheiphilus IPT5 TaxID=1408161 RepID=A0A6A7AXR3_9PLEO|nr:FAD/NAD(P)-binding domain-containing protein [Plenodomus tracheiphilus IPT5]
MSRETEPLMGSLKSAIGPPPLKSFSTGTLQDASAVPAERRKKVIIVGGGINGIQQASTLLRSGCVGINDIQIFEALDGYGGVWQKNKYPGCACDVPAMIYTTSYNINKEWTHYYAQRAEIQGYYEKFAYKYHLEKCTHFRSLVKACTWDDEHMVWHVAVANQETGSVEHWIADVVCQCVGTLDRPKWGTTPGRELFKGISWHTAHWQDYDLTGKRVAIIGCGPSAAQIIPEIVDKTKHLTIYMRSPPVCIPRGDYAYSGFFRWAFKWIPLFAWFVRARMNLRMMIKGRKMATDGDPLNDQMTQLAVTFMESQIKDPELRKILMPNSKYYCKRPLHLDNLYPAFTKPNCTVLRENLVRYTEDGVLSSNRTNGEEIERKFDVIIFGTGFNVAQFLEHEKIKGLNGIDLQEKWKDHPEALYGVATSQFPNMFYCFGPNSAHVWSSQQDTWERQAQFATKAVKAILHKERKGIKLAMHPKRSVEREYNAEVQSRQANVYVWAKPNCVTYYKNDEGWNTFTMPWSWWQFRRMLRKIFWDQWEVIEKPLEKVVIKA